MSHTDRREFVRRLLGVGVAATVAPLACSHGAKPAPAPTPTPTSGAGEPTPETLVLRHFSGSSVELRPHWAQVTSWKRATGDEMLFADAGAAAASDASIAGGIAMSFHDATAVDPATAHRVARIVTWDLVEHGKSLSGAEYALLRSAESIAARAFMPQPFVATVRVTLDEGLSTALTLENTGTESFSFQCAMHTCLRVGDVGRVTIDGLEGATYRDELARGRERRSRRAALRVDGPMDRIYLRRPDRVAVHDQARDVTVLVDRAGFADLMVWTAPAAVPAADNSSGTEAPVPMLGVGPAQLVPAVTIAPGQLWSGVQRLRIGET
jgi:glucose-6-phosphate 1-epimerase